MSDSLYLIALSEYYYAFSSCHLEACLLAHSLLRNAEALLSAIGFDDYPLLPSSPIEPVRILHIGVDLL